MLAISHHVINVYVNHLRSGEKFLISKYINVSILFVPANDGRHNSFLFCLAFAFKNNEALTGIAMERREPHTLQLLIDQY